MIHPYYMEIFKGDAGTGATLVPVYQSSAFGQETAEQIEKIFHNKAAGFAYTRISIQQQPLLKIE